MNTLLKRSLVVLSMVSLLMGLNTSQLSARGEEHFRGDEGRFHGGGMHHNYNEGGMMHHDNYNRYGGEHSYGQGAAAGSAYGRGVEAGSANANANQQPTVIVPDEGNQIFQENE